MIWTFKNLNYLLEVSLNVLELGKLVPTPVEFIFIVLYPIWVYQRLSTLVVTLWPFYVSLTELLTI